MKKMKRLFAIVLSVALIVCALPLSGLVAEAKKLQVTDTKLVSYIEGTNNEGGVYNPGGLGTGQLWTFDGTQEANKNNFYSYYKNSSETAIDFTGCTHITMTLENIQTTSDVYTAQEAYQYWLGHMYFIIKSNGSWSRFPLPAIKAGETSVTVEVDLAMLSGFTISSVQRIGIKTVPKGNNWRSDGNMNTEIFTNFNYGYTDSSAPVLKFHPCKIYGIQRTRTDTTEQKFLRRGFYKFWGYGATNIGWCSTTLTLDPVDISSYDYLEFDVYISDVERLIAEVDGNGKYWYSFRIRLGTSSSNYITAAVDKANAVSGYNHVKVPISDLGSKASAFSFIHFFQENNSFLYVSGGARNYVFGVDNFIATKEPWTRAPAMPTSAGLSVLKEGFFLSRTLIASATSDWLPNASQTASSIKAPTYAAQGSGWDNIAASYHHLEMDIYVEDIDNFTARVTSLKANFLREGDTQANVELLPYITQTGWNHIDIRPYSLASAGERGRLDRVRWLRFRATVGAGSDGVGDHYAIANICFSKDPEYVPPAMSNTYATQDYVEGVQYTMTLSANENVLNSSKIHYFRLVRNGSNVSLDTSNANTIEMDIYASVATNARPGFWVSSNRESGSPRAKYQIPLLNAGWNHVVFYSGGHEATSGSGYTFKGYDFKYPFLEGAFSTSSSVTISIANVAVTRDEYYEVPAMDNTYETKDYVSGAVYGAILAPGDNPLTVGSSDPSKKYLTLGKTLDTSNAEYIEMDIYTSADMDTTPNLWISPDYETGDPRGKYNLPQLTAGWHHVVIDGSLTANTWTQTGQTYNFRTTACYKPFLEYAWFSSSHPTGGKVRIANFAVTRPMWNELPAMTSSDGMLTLYEGKRVGETLGSQGYSSGNRGWLPNSNQSQSTLTFAAETNLYNYDYLEFDFYVENQANFAARVSNLSAQFFSSAAGDTGPLVNFAGLITSDGWNHVKMVLKNYNQSFTDNNVAQYRRATALRFRTYGMTASETGASDHYTIANICFTRNNTTYNEYSVSTEGDIGANFYLAVDNYTDAATAKVRFEFNGTTVTKNISSYTPNSDGQYEFTYDVNPAEMTDTINVQIRNSSNVTVYYYNYTVAGYLNKLIEKQNGASPITSGSDADGSKLKNLCEAMLNYGATAQVQLNHKAEEGAENVDDTFGGTSFTLNYFYKPRNVYARSDLSFKGMTFLVEANSAMRFYVNGKTKDDLDEYTLTLVKSANDVTGHPLLDSNMQVRTGENETGAYFEVYGIEAANLNYFFELQISKADGGGTTILKAAGLSYVRAILLKSASTASELPALHNLCKALYQYSVAADAYFQ